LSKWKLSDLVVWGSALVVGSWIYRQIKGPSGPETAAVQQPPAQAPLPTPAAPAPQPYSDYVVVLPPGPSTAGTIITQPAPTAPTPTTTYTPPPQAPPVTPSGTEAPRPPTTQAEYNLAIGQMLMAFSRDAASCPTALAGKATHYIAEGQTGDQGGVAFYSDQMACLQGKGWLFTFDRTDLYGVQYFVVRHS